MFGFLFSGCCLPLCALFVVYVPFRMLSVPCILVPISFFVLFALFPTLAVGLLGSMLSLPSTRSRTAVLNGNVFLQCPTTMYPCSAQLQDIPAVPHHQISLQCPAQPPSIPAVPNRHVSLQCLTAKYPCSTQPQSLGGWACLLFCCLGGKRFFFFFFFVLWAGSVFFFLLFGRGACFCFCFSGRGREFTHFPVCLASFKATQQQKKTNSKKKHGFRSRSRASA